MDAGGTSNPIGGTTGSGQAAPPCSLPVRGSSGGEGRESDEGEHGERFDAVVVRLWRAADGALLRVEVEHRAEGTVDGPPPLDAVLAAVRDRLTAGPTGREGGADRPPAAPAASCVELTPREREVLELLARRYTDREIAAALGIGSRTAMSHVARILDKLGAADRRAAVAEAARRGLM